MKDFFMEYGIMVLLVLLFIAVMGFATLDSIFGSSCAAVTP